jgi:hypothetical protein
VRTLPLRLSPIDGESLPGYVVRYAHTFELPPGEVVRALGLGDTIREAGRYGVRLSAQQLERVPTATGIDCDQLQAMVLARFAGRAFPQASISAPNAVPTETRVHELTWQSRFCPQCLRERGAWLLRWQLSWSVLCTRHELLLARRCRRCGAIPRIGAHAAWPRDHAGELSDPTRCWHRQPQRDLCRAPLTRQKPAATTDIALLPAQRRIDALLDGHLILTPTFAGETLEPAAYLRDLRALSSLLHKLQWPFRTSRQLLDQPRALASILPEALRLADLPDKTAFSDALRNQFEQHHQLLAPIVLDQFSPFRHALQRTATEAASHPTQQQADGHAHGQEHPSTAPGSNYPSKGKLA